MESILKEEYTNNFRRRIVIVGQVRILAFFPKYCWTISRWLGDAISKFVGKRHASQLL